MSAQPGERDLDVQVAVEIMGYKWDGSPRGNRRLFCPDGELVAAKDRGKPIHFIGFQVPRLPRFSTDMTAAWLVVAKMAERWTDFTLRCVDDDQPGDGWYALFRRPDYGVASDSASLAICYAALREAGVKP